MRTASTCQSGRGLELRQSVVTHSGQESLMMTCIACLVQERTCYGHSLVEGVVGEKWRALQLGTLKRKGSLLPSFLRREDHIESSQWQIVWDTSCHGRTSKKGNLSRWKITMDKLPLFRAMKMGKNTLLKVSHDMLRCPAEGRNDMPEIF